MLTRHIKHSLTTIAVILCSLTASAHDFEVGGIFYNITSSANKTVEVTYKGSSYNEYNEYSGSITIPSTVTYNSVRYSVTSIGDFAFYDSENLTSITIPEGVMSIGEYAFNGCSSLKSITIPLSVTSIGVFTFGDCHSLTAIFISKNVRQIRYGAFSGCSGLISIKVADDNTIYDSRNNCNAIIETKTNMLITGCQSTIIPLNVTGIGVFAFWGCSSLTSITIHKGMTSIGECAFGECNNLNSIKVAAENSIYDSRNGCNAIIESKTNKLVVGCQSTIIPSNVTSIGAEAFRRCNKLTTITLPKGVTSIEEGAFSECTSLTAIIVPESVKNIGNSAFSLCSSLTSITLPESLTNIGNYAFRDCHSLTAITISKGVMSIGYAAFSYCHRLTDVYCYAETLPTIASDAFNYSSIASATLHVPTSAMNAYKTTAPWNKFSLIKSLTDKSVTNITLSKSSVNVTIGEEFTLTTTIAPSDATDKTISWSSSNTGVATVDSKGKVTAKAAGTATITATANDGSGVKASCVVTVKRKVILVSNITLNQSTATLTEGGTLTLTATVTPSNADNTSVSWSSSNTSVATVDSKGKVTAKAAGSATITATANDGSGVKASCVVTVEKRVVPVTSITLSQSTATLTKGESLTLTATVTPSDATTKAVTWSSSDTNIATIDSKGVVTAIALGTATITASTTDGSRLSATCVVTVKSPSGTCGSNLTWRLSEAGELIIEGTGAMTNYANESDVPWHIHKASINSVTINDGVTSIGVWAFNSCSSLTTITIPEGVTSIGAFAFYGCSSLTAITLPKGVTSIGGYAFSDCSSLTAITIPEGVTSIGEFAFYNCVNLAFITFPEEVTSVGEAAFYGCSSLTAITIPKGIEQIGEKAFASCAKLQEVHCYAKELPSTALDAFEHTDLTQATLYVPVSALESYTNTAPWSDFGDIKGMIIEKVEIDGLWYNLMPDENVAEVTAGDEPYTGDIIIPSTVTYEGTTYRVTGIGNSAFASCYLLTSVNIPEYVTAIGELAFYYCIGLTTMTLADEVQQIGASAFEGCLNLASITLPHSLTRVGRRVFAYCDKLLKVYCAAESVPAATMDAFEDMDPAQATLYVPASTLEAYRSTAPWSSFGTIVALTDEDTGMKNSEITNQKSELIHDLRGHRVDNPTKGDIYIVGGRKKVW